MSTPKTKPKENPQGGAGSNQGLNPEKPKEAVKPYSPLESQTAAAKMDVLEGSDKAKSEMRREVLEKQVIGVDAETAEKIAKYNESKEIAEQVAEFERIKMVAYTFLAKAFKEGIAKEALEDLQGLKNIPAEVVNKFNATEKVAVQKLQQIALKAGSKLPAFQEKWKEVVVAAYAQYDKVKDENWVVKTFKKHPVLTVAGLALGAYGIYHFFFKKEENSEDNKSHNDLLKFFKLDSLKSKALGAALGALVLGGLIGHEQIGDFVANLAGAPTGLTQKLIGLVKSGSLSSAWALLKNWNSSDSTNPPALPQAVTQVVDKIGEDLKWLDDKVHFSDVKDKIVAFSKEHGVPVPDLKDLNLKQVAHDLNITQDNKTSWLEYAELGGAALLIYKWMGKKGLAVNAGFYLFVLREGKNSYAGQLIHAFTGEIDKAKNAILGRFSDNPAAHFLVTDALADMSVQNFFDHALDWMKENPAEAMIAMNGLFACRMFIWGALKKLPKAGWDVTKYAWNNKGQAVLAAGALATLYVGRRAFVKDLVGAMYDDPNGKDAQATLAKMDSILNIDRSKPESLPEKKADEITRAFREDPINAFKKFYSQFQSGEFSLGSTVLGVVLLIKGASVPVQLSKLSVDGLKTMVGALGPDTTENAYLPMVVGGVEMFVFGSMAWGGFESYKTLYKSGGIEKFEIISRSFWSLVPNSKEWWFVLKSSVCAPLTPVLRRIDQLRLGTIEKTLDEIVTMAKASSPNIDAIREKISAIKKTSVMADVKSIEADLSKATFGQHSYNLSKRLGKVNDNLGIMDGEARNLSKGQKDELIKLVEETKEQLKGAKKMSTGLLQRVELMMKGNFKDALASKEAMEEMNEFAKAKPLNALQATSGLFRKPDGAAKTVQEATKDIERIKKELTVITDINLKRTAERDLAALETYVDPTKAHQFKIDGAELSKLEGAEKAKKIESLAREFEARERGVQSRFNAEVEKIAAEAKALGKPVTDPSVMEKLEKLDKDLTIPFAKNKQEMIKTMNEEFKKLPGDLKKNPALVAQVKHAIEGSEGTLMTRMTKFGKGRVKVLALMGALIFAEEKLINHPEHELLQIFSDIGPDLKQLIFDVMPFTGTFSNFYTLFTNKEFISKHDVSGTWEMASKAIWGTVGLAGDIVTLASALPSGSGSVWANVGLRVAKIAATEGKMAIAAKKLIQYLPRIEKIAERMGGPLEFGKKVAKMINTDGKALQSLQKIEKVGMVVGTGMEVGGLAYRLRYAYLDTQTEIELAPELSGVPAPMDHHLPVGKPANDVNP